MTIIDEGDGVYHAGMLDIYCGKYAAQIHIDRFAEFQYSDMREIGQLLIELANKHHEELRPKPQDL